MRKQVTSQQSLTTFLLDNAELSHNTVKIGILTITKTSEKIPMPKRERALHKLNQRSSLVWGVIDTTQESKRIPFSQSIPSKNVPFLTVFLPIPAFFTPEPAYFTVGQTKNKSA